MSYKWTVKNALKADKGSTPYQIAARTGLPSSVVSRNLSKMFLDGEIDRVEAGNAALSYFEYFLKKGPDPIPGVPEGSVLNRKDDDAVRHRVTMLKKMRDRLIEEYHPLLNAVISDYEWFLKPQNEPDDDLI